MLQTLVEVIRHVVGIFGSNTKIQKTKSWELRSCLIYLLFGCFALFLLVFLGFPVAFCMIALSFAFGFWFFGDTLGPQMFSNLHAVATNYVLTALPLFIFMGAALERSGIAERLFIAIQLWIGKLRGGLALTSISMCGVFLPVLALLERLRQSWE